VAKNILTEEEVVQLMKEMISADGGCRIEAGV
jgi:hypothetical protein